MSVLVAISADAAAPARRDGVSVSRATANQSRNVSQSRAAKSVSVVARSAKVAPTNDKPSVVARAGTTISVIGGGVKVNSAEQNTAINQSCAEKYNGCMDSFCMIDNTSGGRCICSNQIFDLDKAMDEIQESDRRSFELTTVGVETIETGVDVAGILRTSNNGNLSVWNNGALNIDSDEDIRGDALFMQMHEMCMGRIPECDNEKTILQMLYNQKIKSDCMAYSNTIKQLKQDSLQKLDVAKKALRNAAFDKITNENKLDLGQCTSEFKKCMQTTGGCGDDFSKCASVIAMQSTNARAIVARSAQTYQIQGAKTNIEISANTYDTLVAKRPLCETVTKSCVAVADKVWDTFLKEVAPQIKNAELIAEDNARQDCVGNISNCFQKACRDNIDPNDPDGSYDMCLTRPATMLNVCRVPLNACGIDAESAENAEKSPIWNYVLARLAAMRVNSCTTQVRECLQDKDRCGADYTGCIGLDTDTIIRMCPYDKLTGCQSVYADKDIRGDAVYDELANMVTGIMLNIDNNMMDECMAALDESMIRVCGDTENCDSMVTDEMLGAGSLDYQLCEYRLNTEAGIMDFGNCRSDVSLVTDEELGRVPSGTTGSLGPVTPLTGLLRGTIYWGSVTIDDNGRLIDVDEYFKSIDESNVSPELREPIAAELGKIQNNIDSVIASVESDPMVQFCMTGRNVQGITDKKSQSQVARFPNLSRQMRMKIATSALKIVKDNYYKKYDELIERQMHDYHTIAERQAAIMGENAKDARREAARKSCVSLAAMAAMPKAPKPPLNSALGIVLASIAVAASIVATVFTFGAASVSLGVALQVIVSMSVIALGTGVVGVSDLATQGALRNKAGNSLTALSSAELSATYTVEDFNYRETVSTNFEWDTLVCHKCVRSQNCADARNPMFGKPNCRRWSDVNETCTDIEF